MKENRTPPSKDVGIWIRVSTEEQAEGDSPEHHEIRAREYAEKRGWTVREVYDLAGVSGKAVWDHPRCQRMMTDVRSRRISVLIFSSLVRLGRDSIELIRISRFFREQCADLVAIDEAIDTTTPGGRILFALNATRAELEREDIVKRVTDSVPIRAKLGKPLGGLAPFGYRWEGKKLVIDPTDAPVRKLVYELFAEHKRKKTVARLLNERGFRTRGTKNRAGGKFSDTTVSRLISDPTAKGEHRLNYTKSLGDRKQWRIKPEHEWVINRVEPIVSEPLWNQCNALLEARKTKGERPAKKPAYAFTGFVRCACENKMYVPSNTPKWVCLKCRNKIPVADLDALFRDELRRYMVDAGNAAAFVGASQSELREKNDLLEKLQSERKRVKFESDKCFELYQSQALTVDQFRERFQPLDARNKEIAREIPRLEGEIAALGANEVSTEHVISEGQFFYDRWPTLGEEEKRRVVELFLKQITIGQEDVTVQLVTLPCLESVADRQHTGTGSSRRRA